MLQKISDHVVITYALKAKTKHAKDNCLTRLKPREEQCWDVMRPRIIISIKFSRKLIAEMNQSSQISALFAQQLIFYTFETAILIFTNQPTRSNWNKSMHQLFVDKCRIDTFAKDLMESGVNRTLYVASSRVISMSWIGKKFIFELKIFFDLHSLIIKSRNWNQRRDKLLILETHARVITFPNRKSVGYLEVIWRTFNLWKFNSEKSSKLLVNSKR